ncbi:amidase, partial [Thioclava sp. BHET1]
MTTESKIDLLGLNVAAVQSGFAEGRFTSESLTQACLDQIAATNPTFNAIIYLNDHALDEARAIDQRRAAGEALGPLAGVPVVIKDTMDMAG